MQCYAYRSICCRCVCVCVCVCVCLTVTCQYCIKMAKHRITQTVTHDIHGLWFSDAKDLGEFQWGHPQLGAKCR